MMRCLAGTLGLLLVLSVTSGCNRQCFLAKEVFDEAHSHLLPPNIDQPGAGTHEPLTGGVATPPTVSSPDRPPRYLSLQEAIAIALENGTASTRTFGGTGGGTYDTTLIGNPPSFGSSQQITGQTDYIRVLALQPAISAANMEAAVSRFDAQYVTTMNWSAVDNLQQGLQSFQNGMNATFGTGVAKGTPTGGIAGIFFQTDYRLLSTPPTGNFNVLNPSYTTRLTFGVEQPLWRDYGIDINQLLGRSPTAQANALPGQLASAFNNRQAGAQQGSGLVSNDGILIARLRFDQQRAEFERNVHIMLANVEIGYWRLYQAYGRLYAFDEVLRIAHRAWMIGIAQYQTGKIGQADFAPVEAQFHEFRGERAAALGDVLNKERELRGIVGLPLEDGTRIIPISPPLLAAYSPDWGTAYREALTLRPELIIARENLRLAQYNLEVARNFLKPDLRAFANYSPVGFGTRLDGSDTFIDGTGTPRPSNALQSLSSGHFADWTLGVNLSVPIGFRFEHAAVRAARMGLIQSFHLVKSEEQKAAHYLAQQYQKLDEWQKQIEVRRAERRNYAQAVEVRFKKYQAGQATPDILLDLQRRLASAQVKEYEAIAEYNATLARFEQAKGTIMRYDNVHIAEGPLPHCAQVRAVDNEKERSRALVLRERPDPLAHPGRLASPEEGPALSAPILTVPLGEPPVFPPPAEKKVETLPAPPRELPKDVEQLERKLEELGGMTGTTTIPPVTVPAGKSEVQPASATAADVPTSIRRITEPDVVPAFRPPGSVANVPAGNTPTWSPTPGLPPRPTTPTVPAIIEIR